MACGFIQPGERVSVFVSPLSSIFPTRDVYRRGRPEQRHRHGFPQHTHAPLDNNICLSNDRTRTTFSHSLFDDVTGPRWISLLIRWGDSGHHRLFDRNRQVRWPFFFCVDFNFSTMSTTGRNQSYRLASRFSWHISRDDAKSSPTTSSIVSSSVSGKTMVIVRCQWIRIVMTNTTSAPYSLRS